MINPFEKVFCINLDRRKDRWNSVEAEFKRVGLDVERFSAVEATEGFGNLTKGQYGCYQSHREIWARALKEGHDSVLVLEDDVVFHPQFTDLLSLYMKEVPGDYELLYLGGNHTEFGARPMQMISEHAGKLKRTLTLHAYVVTKKILPTLLELTQEILVPIDTAVAEFQTECKAYGLSPNLASQRPGFSDINQSIVDYRFIIPLG